MTRRVTPAWLALLLGTLPAAVAQQRPAAGPDTALGKLVHAERSETPVLQSFSVNQMAEYEQLPGVATYVVLIFEGKARRDFDKELADFRAALTPQAGAKPWQDPRSWLTDAKGRKYSNPVLAVRGHSRQLAFAVPPGADGFTFHDGEKAFRVKLPAAKPAAAR